MQVTVCKCLQFFVGYHYLRQSCLHFSPATRGINKPHCYQPINVPPCDTHHSQMSTEFLIYKLPLQPNVGEIVMDFKTYLYLRFQSQAIMALHEVITCLVSLWTPTCVPSNLDVSQSCKRTYGLFAALEESMLNLLRASNCTFHAENNFLIYFQLKMSQL